MSDGQCIDLFSIADWDYQGKTLRLLMCAQNGARRPRVERLGILGNGGPWHDRGRRPKAAIATCVDPAARLRKGDDFRSGGFGVLIRAGARPWGRECRRRTPPRPQGRREPRKPGRSEPPTPRQSRINETLRPNRRRNNPEPAKPPSRASPRVDGSIRSAPSRARRPAGPPLQGVFSDINYSAFCKNSPSKGLLLHRYELKKT